MHQGWPKFTQNLWYATPDDGLAALVYSPSEVTARVGNNGCKIKIFEETSYPMDNKMCFTVQLLDKKMNEVAFPLHLRIPGWCKEAVVSINGQLEQKVKGGEMAIIRRTWKSKDKVELVLPMEVQTTRWYENSVAVEYGPLVFGLKMEEKWEKKNFKNEEITRYGEFFVVVIVFQLHNFMYNTEKCNYS